jgi:outer membrane protein OmpA-like peptidoglycan-associated protein
VTLIEFLSLRACFQDVIPPKAPPVLSFDTNIVALSDGSVMVAAPGTISRDVINWFNDKSASPRQFDIGVEPFMPNSIVPAPEAKVRLARFAMELKANPDVNTTITVCSSGSSTGDRQLAVGRAIRLKGELAAMQIDASRISTRACGSTAGSASAASASQRDGQIINIALAHGG